MIGENHVKGRRRTAAIALIASVLLLFQGVVLDACTEVPGVGVTSDASVDASRHASHGAAHGSHGTAADQEPASHGHDTSCPMSGLMVPCGAVALATDDVVSVPTSAIASANRLAPTFLIPPSVVADDLFHPPRA